MMNGAGAPQESGQERNERMRRIRNGLWLLILFAAVTAAGLAEKLLVTTDLHLTSGTETTDPVLQAIALQVQDSDGVLFLGDEANSGHLEEHRRFVQFLRTLDKPVYVIPGNHDYSLEMDTEGFLRMFGPWSAETAFSRDPSSVSYAARTGEGTILLMLDTNAYQNETVTRGRISEDLLKWLRELLPKLKGQKVVCCGHHPLLDGSGGTDRTQNADALTDLLREAGISLYMCGHRHNNYAVEENGLVQICVGTPGGYPAWMGEVDTGEEVYRVRPLHAEGSREAERLHSDTKEMARRMGRSALEGTSGEGNEAAVAWFEEAFMTYMEGAAGEKGEQLLRDPAAQVWREAQVRSVVRDWILGVLSQPGPDVRRVQLQLSATGAAQ